MRQIFKIFFRTELTRPWLVLLALLAGGLLEAMSLGSLLPATNSLVAGNDNPNSVVDSTVRKILAIFSVQPGFGTIIALILTLFLLRTGLLFVAMTYATNTGAKVTVNLRQRLIQALFKAKWRFYGDQNAGDIANAISNTSAQAGIAFQVSAEVIACMAQILAYCAIAMLINWRAAVAGILGGILVSLFSGRLVSVTRRHGLKVTDRVALLTSDMVDMMQNIKALKSMQRYDAFLEQFNTRLGKLRRNHFAINYSRYGLLLGNDLIVACLIGVGAYVTHKYANATLPELTVLGLLFFQVVSYVARMQRVSQQAAQFESAYFHVSKLISSAESAHEIWPGRLPPHMGNGCRFEDVSFSHNDKPTLRNVMFHMPAGHITVLQGRSGAGKTTLVDLLIGFHRPSAGRILIGKDDLQSIDMTAWRRRIGYVPQELVLIHDTIRANIALGDHAITDTQIEKAIDKAGLRDFLDSLPGGLDTDVGEYGGKLSGGQRQRISLARALVHEPELLILDEVTSALDPATEADIVANIASLRGQYTILAITHRPEWTKIADRLYDIKDGRVHEIKAVTTRRKKPS